MGCIVGAGILKYIKTLNEKLKTETDEDKIKQIQEEIEELKIEAEHEFS